MDKHKLNKRQLFRSLASSKGKKLIAAYEGLWQVHCDSDGPQRQTRRDRRLQMIRALQDACAAAGIFNVLQTPQPLMRWFLLMLYRISTHTQAFVGRQIGYSQPYVSRILKPADAGLTLRPSQYRRWLAVFLRPDELALLD